MLGRVTRPRSFAVFVCVALLATALGLVERADASTGAGRDVSLTVIADAPTPLATGVIVRSSAYRTVPIASLSAPAPSDLYSATSNPVRTVTTAAGATVSCSTCRAPNYRAPATYTGADTVYYVVQPCGQVRLTTTTFGLQCSGDLGRGTISVTVVPNQPPVAVDDAIAARLPVLLDVADNDTDGNGALERLTIVYAIGTTAAGGRYECGQGVSYSPIGGCSYTPTGTYVGIDSFGYTLRDAAGVTSDAVVTVTVSADAAPVANPATMTVRVGTGGQLPTGQGTDLAPFASDPDGDALIVASVPTPPVNGAVSCNGAVCSYVPTNPFAPLDDSFTYIVTDGLLSSDPASVTVHVVTFPSVTVAGDTVTVDPLTTTAIDVSANDGALGTIEAYVGTSSNSQPYSCTATGCQYTSGAAVVTDTFGYVRSDGETSAYATVTVNVRNVDPAARDEIGATTAGTALVKDLSSFVSDRNGNLAGVEAVAQPAHGTAACEGYRCTYTPAPTFTGADTFTYRAVDALGAVSAPATITVNVGIVGQIAGILLPGGTNQVWSGPATTDHPLATSVGGATSGGAVSVVESPAGGTPPSGYDLVGFQAVITAPAGTVDQPLQLQFAIAPGVLPDTQTAAEIVVFRNGAAVPPCADASGRADPAPCLAGSFGDGAVGMYFRVLTVAASTWQFGVINPLQADAGGPYTVDEGATVVLDATGSTASGAPTYAWTPATMTGADTARPTFRGVDDGDVAVSVTVSDGAARSTATSTVHVRNVAPTVATATVTPAVVGATTTISGTVTDPGVADTLTVTVDWGDGSTTPATVTARSFSASHVYRVVGALTITVTARDDDNGSSNRLVPVTVRYPAFSLTDDVLPPPGVNRIAAGSKLSIAFTLGGSFGADVLAAGSPTLTPVNCTTWAPTGAPTASPGTVTGRQTGKTYRYEFVAATSRALRGTCQSLTLTLADTTVVVLRYRFS